MKLSEWIKQNADKEIEFVDGKIAIKEPESTACMPERGDTYYIINTQGFAQLYTWGYEDVDYERFEHGNCFRTEEDADNAVEALKVRQELLRCGGKATPHEGDWHICWNDLDHKVDTDFVGSIIQPFGIYFKSEQDAKDAIGAVDADRIKKYLFGFVEGDE